MNAQRKPLASEDAFARGLLHWYDRHGRKDLPWQHPRTPYRVWLSEVMLQQTQVRTVIAYFGRFVATLPSLAALAAASEDQVLALWSGLGYYSRARNLQRAARICVDQHDGHLPAQFEQLAALPGIGRSTAGAILAQAFDQPHAILDGNVRRVLARWHGVEGWPGAAPVQKQLWRLAAAHVPRTRAADYTQAIMDLGSMVCTRLRPHCGQCPLAADCVALREDRVHELPQARPARSKPVRGAVLLIARDAQGRILLERRPPSGIWARLWSLPEADDTDAAQRLLRQRFHANIRTHTLLPSFRHSFTHYHLQITPLLCDVASGRFVADDGDHAWCTPTQFAQLGLPAPVRSLLASLEPSA